MVRKTTLDQEVGLVLRHFDSKTGQLSEEGMLRFRELLDDAGYQIRQPLSPRGATIWRNSKAPKAPVFIARDIFTLEPGYTRVVFRTTPEAEDFFEDYTRLEQRPPQPPHGTYLGTYFTWGLVAGFLVNYICSYEPSLPEVDGWKGAVAPVVLSTIALLAGVVKARQYHSAVERYSLLREQFNFQYSPAATTGRNALALAMYDQRVTFLHSGRALS